ncbi:NAD(P)/FAD-dependent oxidoreductase [Mucilaginibacter sp. ZT4R22]|uniref:NADH:ubiquinone reductase (non-electrogenic) n=1 Tax=Mucilaginibacter pankratovii TaxID=2772110 RepID=A0ABR7WSX7_9SPHI|nr:NAD(P)/FAD-dependent oxidoreductase [Mucilaginibacter pankratovii]MBD1365405.1 NAD(P)/FAD-dependent oxidoreductase [Mucilaginibacter pankratovii]
MKIVIIGGGFAGLNLAKHLAGNPIFNVTLVDKNNYHLFPPLLYQVSTAFIEASNITYPFRRMFQYKENLRFHLGELKEVVASDNKIKTSNGDLSYDILVLAMGTETNYFGLESIEKHALPLKTIDDAIHLRNHLLLNAEKAVRTNDPVDKCRLQNIVISGGGPTGVEVSGMLAEMIQSLINKDYPELKEADANIYLISSGNALLGPMSKKSQAEAYKVLDKLGVQVKLNTAVKGYINGDVHLSNGGCIPAATLVWTSGVIARQVPGLPNDCIGRGNRIIVDEFNKVKGAENIFAIGDQCLQTTDADYPNGHPQLAQVAIQQGFCLASNLKRLHSGQVLKPFKYKNKGSMAIISKYKAVVDLPKAFFKGLPAWLVWLFVHIIPIVGFGNKVKLAYNWFLSLMTNDPALRLIIRPKK